MQIFTNFPLLQIMLQGRKFDKEISKMSNPRGFARPMGGGGGGVA